MFYLVKEIDHHILNYIKDDPIRPEIPPTSRVGKNKFICYISEQEDPRAIVCVSLHDFIPGSVNELSVETTVPNTAIFYTIWSYEKGAGTELLREAVNSIKKEYPDINRFVTLSPKTEMARRFHLKNGANIFRENETTVNYEYLI